MAPTSSRIRVAAGLLLPLALAACSLPTDERVDPYNPADLPAVLTNTTTTSTTTTTTLPAIPESLPDGETTTSTSTTSTVPAPDTAPVEIFYTIGFSDEVQPVRRDLFAPVPISNVISQLESPSGDIAAGGLRSSVRAGLIEEVLLDRATATVALDPAVLDRLSNDEQRRAIGQIVLTFTSFVTVDEGAIGFVRFEVDGDAIAVFVPSLGGSSDPGEPLAFVDFSSLIVTTSLTPATTTTIITTTTTTVPTDDTSDG